MRGYFGVGIEHNKSAQNIGTLWRTAYSFDASLLCTIGRRYDRQVTDTVKAMNHVPLQHFAGFDDFFAALPQGCRLIGVELDPKAKPLRAFKHPERAFYLLGAEDHGLSKEARGRCHSLVMLPGRHCLNVSVAGSIVLAHRVMQHEREDALMRDACSRVREQLMESGLSNHSAVDLRVREYPA